MKIINNKLCIIIVIFLSCCILLYVIFNLKIKSDKITDLKNFSSEKEFHPWIHRRRDYNPPGYSPLGGNNIFFIKTDKIQEASALLKDDSFYDLANREFFYFTGHVDSDNNSDHIYYLVRSIKEKHANGRTLVSVDSNHNLYVGYGFLWGFQFEMEFVDNPIVVRLPHRPNQLYVDFMAAK